MTITAKGRARRGAPLVAAALLLLTLSGCLPAGPRTVAVDTGRAGPDSVTPITPLVVPRVLAYCPLEDATHYSGYPLAVDEVYICRGDGTRATDGVSTSGPWEAAYQILDPTVLLRAYQNNNARRKRICTNIRYPTDPLIIWVHRDGVTRSYYAPVDGCGVPNTTAAAAYRDAKRTLLVEVDLGAPGATQRDGAQDQ